MRTCRLHVAGMCCPSEEPIIRKQLAAFAVSAIRFDHLSRCVEVDHSGPEDQPLAEALNAAGLQAQILNERPRARPIPWITPRLALALLLALGSEGLGFGHSHGQGTGPFWLALCAMLLTGRQPWVRAALALSKGQLGIHVLMVLAVLGAVWLGEWPEAAMVLTLFRWSEQLEASSLARVSCEVESLLRSAPEAAEVERRGSWVKVPVETVEVGEKVRVSAGDRVPLDGVILQGSSFLDQANITGESVPVEKEPGDTVFAGCLNQAGVLLVEVTGASGSRQLDRIVAAVRRAQQEKAPLQRTIDRFAAVYTPLVLLGSLLMALGPWLLGFPQAGVWFYRALVLLVIACPCALVLASPITLVSGLTWMTRLGILVKGAAALEEAARIDTVAFDKTGTLTEGQPRLVEVHSLGDAEQCLRVAASLQDPSRHPLAESLKRAYREAYPSLELYPVEDWQSWSGRGVGGRILQQSWCLISRRQTETVYSQALHPEHQNLLEDWEQRGLTPSLLLCEGQIRAFFGFLDSARAEARDALEKLRVQGMRLLMVTGDRIQVAQNLAKELQLEEVHAQQLPEEKQAIIEAELSHGRRVAMVGDGVNDAPTLARAHLGVAMGRGGSDLAIEVGDVVLMADDLERLPLFFATARRVQRRLRFNIALALLSKLVFLAMAVAGQATLWMAVVADVGVSLLVIFSGVLLLHSKPAVTKI